MENFSNNFKLSKSEIPRLELSVRMGCGRMCDYCPQTLYIKKYKEFFGKSEILLTLETIKSVTNNIPDNTIISWTGFTEPFDCVDFPEIVEHFDKRQMKQVISTTLVGRKNNIDYFLSNLDIFKDGITLHLPDNNGYMKGKFDEKYSNNLSMILEAITKLEKKDYMVLLIGDDFHKSIKKTIKSFEEKHGSEKIVKAKYLNTRNSSINVQKFGLKQTKKNLTHNDTFYCSYKRLNRGVMLPNGNVVICCQDYGLEGQLGSLKEKNLNDLYNSIEKDSKLSKQFVSGNYSPCVNCEHYTSVNESSSSGRVL